jgi:superfamily II DNA or RNA helicase
MAKHRTITLTPAAPRSLAAYKGFTLRPYQQDLIDRSRTALRAKQSSLVVLHTDGGKTAVIAELARLAGITGNQVSVICHRREIALQLAAAIRHHSGKPPELVIAVRKAN